MKNRIYSKIIVIVSLFLFLGCSTGGVTPEKGVSKKLAIERAKTISKLKYSLHFAIPKEKDSIIEGVAIIDFNLSDRGEVILDFRHDSISPVKSILVNGKKSNFSFINEHIVIPAKHILKGNNTFQIEFIAGEQSLNRREDLLYTLLVPDRSRTLFPCFDQPNLKAKFSLTLDIPNEWTEVQE